MKPIERIRHWKQLKEDNRWTSRQLADHLNVSRSHVDNSLGVLKLPTPILDTANEGLISIGHAKTLSGVMNHDPEFQDALFRRILNEGLSTAETQVIAKAWLKELERKLEHGISYQEDDQKE